MKVASNISQCLFQFSKSINGQKVKFRWEQLPRHRYEEFLDFKMNYYVKDEVTHALAGIYKNSDSLEEYRQIIAKIFKSPSYHTYICSVDDESNKLVGFNSLTLYKKGEIYKDIMQAIDWPSIVVSRSETLLSTHCWLSIVCSSAKTAEVQRFYEILHSWNNLCPVPNILNKYGVNEFFDDGGSAIHPDCRGYCFSTEILRLRHSICKANNIPLTGAWMTSTAMQNSSKTEGWDTIYEVSSEQLEDIVGVKFPNAPQIYTYKVKIIQ